eukprot:TRINITY_DN79954_c0_g1_i1.p1 TRINITY_DN79954_c0_g1~~TRINITY_DN79954_c0_g1_i1.p1  ORF type:complete len:941 (-),score=183.67 TRINITY_DN79954_c0_g1_i1:58-2880(-)
MHRRDHPQLPPVLRSALALAASSPDATPSSIDALTADSSMELSDVTKSVHLAYLANPNSVFLGRIYNESTIAPSDQKLDVIMESASASNLESDAAKLQAILLLLETLRAGAKRDNVIPCLCSAEMIDDMCLPWMLKSLTSCGFPRALAHTARKAAKHPSLQATVLRTAARYDELQTAHKNHTATCKALVKTAIPENERFWDWGVDMSPDNKVSYSFAYNLFTHQTSTHSLNPTSMAHLTSRLSNTPVTRTSSPVSASGVSGTPSFDFPVLASCVMEIVQTGSRVDRCVVEALFEVLVGSINSSADYANGRMVVFNRPIAEPHVFQLITFLITARVDRETYMWTLSSLTSLLVANPLNLELMYKVLENDWPEWITPVLLSSHHKREIVRAEVHGTIRASLSHRLDDGDSALGGLGVMANCSDEDFVGSNDEDLIDDENGTFDEDELDEKAEARDDHFSQTVGDYGKTLDVKSKKLVFSYEILLAVLMATTMVCKCSSTERCRNMLYKVLDKLDQKAMRASSGSAGDISRVFLFASLKKLQVLADSEIADPESVFFGNMMELVAIVVDFIFFGIGSSSAPQPPHVGLADISISSLRSSLTGSSSANQVAVKINLKSESDSVQIPDLVLTDRLSALMSGIVNSNRLFAGAENTSSSSMEVQSRKNKLRDSANRLKMKTRAHIHQRLLDKLEQVADFSERANKFLLMLSDPSSLETDLAVVNQRCTEMGAALYQLQRNKTLGTGQRKKIAKEETFSDMLNFYVLSVHAKHREAKQRKKDLILPSPDTPLNPALRGKRGETFVVLANQFVSDQISRTVTPSPAPIHQLAGLPSTKIVSPTGSLPSAILEDKSADQQFEDDADEEKRSSAAILNIVKDPIRPHVSSEKPTASLALGVAVIDQSFKLPENPRGRAIAEVPSSSRISALAARESTRMSSPRDTPSKPH